VYGGGIYSGIFDDETKNIVMSLEKMGYVCGLVGIIRIIRKW
jgi:hypothetical protein